MEINQRATDASVFIRIIWPEATTIAVFDPWQSVKIRVRLFFMGHR